MTTALPVARFDIPIGRTADGQPVMFDPLWFRNVFKPLIDRVGGDTALSNLELASMTFAFADPIYQRPVADDAMTDLIQPRDFDQSFGDVMQSAGSFDLGETTYQR